MVAASARTRGAWPGVEIAAMEGSEPGGLPLARPESQPASFCTALSVDTSTMWWAKKYIVGY